VAARSFTPPAALKPTMRPELPELFAWFATARSINSADSGVALTGTLPVDVLTKSQPPAMDASHAAVMSAGSFSSPLSMITFRSTWSSGHTARTALVKASAAARPLATSSFNRL